MPLLPADGRFLERSLELAELAAAFACPNPTVGCVLAIQENVQGEGAHFFAARDHAEIAALKAASAAHHEVRGATAYVTLEPCSHHGRTGPCADALIAAGVRRCVVATVDPNPLVRGQGIAKLRAAGVDVLVLDPESPLVIRARRLNDAFAFSIQHGRPFVTLKAAVSLDGRIAPPSEIRTAREPFWLTGPAARADVAQLRHTSDALLTGIGTVLADDPQLTDRTSLPRRRPLLRVVLDSHLRTPVASRLVQGAADDLLIVCDRDANHALQGALEQHRLEVVRIQDLSRPQSLARVLDLLQQRGIRSVLTEGGSALNGALLGAGLVDRVVLYYADRELGPEGLPFARGFPSPYLLQERLTRQERTSLPNGQTEDVRVTGYLHDPWQDLGDSLR